MKPVICLLTLSLYAFNAHAIEVTDRAENKEEPKIALGMYFNQGRVYAPADEEAFANFEELAGREARLYMNYQGWMGQWNVFSRRLGDNAVRHKSVYMVVWEPWEGKNPDANWTCRAIAEGAQDDYVRQYARDVKAWGQPLMIRLAHEMNGSWYPWGTAFPKSADAAKADATKDARNNGNTPEDYVAMWRHVWEIFHAEKADNAFWVWSPNLLFINAANSSQQARDDYRALYPGDKYVDWIGLDGYNNGVKDKWRSFSELFGPSYAAMIELSDKPLMIAEFGCTEGGAPAGSSKAQWITQSLLRDIPEQFPRVKLINWFNRDKSKLGEADWRFNSSPAAAAAFRAAVNAPLYQGTIELKH